MDTKVRSIADAHARYMRLAWSDDVPVSERYIPRRFARKGAIGYGRTAYGMAPKDCRAVIERLEACDRLTARIGYTNLRAERASSSGQASIAVGYDVFSREDFDRAACDYLGLGGAA